MEVLQYVFVVVGFSDNNKKGFEIEANLVHYFEELAILKNIRGANLNQIKNRWNDDEYDYDSDPDHDHDDLKNLNFHIVELVQGCLSAVKVKFIARRHLLQPLSSIRRSSFW